jgi:hypothetical protein
MYTRQNRTATHSMCGGSGIAYGRCATGVLRDADGDLVDENVSIAGRGDGNHSKTGTV